MPATSFTSVPILGNHVATSPSVASSTSGSDHLTLAVLGCGTMGVTILKRILDQLAEMDAPRPLQVITSSASVASMSALYSSHASSAAGAAGATSAAGAPDDMPDHLPTHFLACVRRPEVGKRVRAALWSHSSAVKVVVDDNVHAVQQAGVVILACQSSEAEDLLAAPGMARALSGKLLISICAGITADQVEEYLYGSSPDAAALTVATTDAISSAHGRCRIVRAIPNAASLIGESMTVIDTATSTGALPADLVALVTWIFRRIGSVVHHPHQSLTKPAKTAAASRAAASSAAASTALGTAGPAFFALMLEAAIDGAVAMGMSRAEAQLMAAQSMRGAAGLVLQNNEHPALLRDRISTPGGCAVHGLLALEEGGVRSTIARAMREATAAAAQEGSQ